MTICYDMKEGDILVCDICGLEVQVVKGCTCESEEEGACQMPMQCCGKAMTLKS
jgi:hypothetical protein